MAEQLPRRAWKGRVLCLVVALGAGLMASGGTWVSLRLKPTPIPPLLQNLPRSGPPTDQGKITERLRARFPMGSSETEVIRELWLEGFSPVTLQDPQRVAEFDTLGKGGFDVCRIHGRVSWTADNNGRVIAISGGSVSSCS